jgi:hypothetical protein
MVLAETSMSALGHKLRCGDVCFTPESGHVRATRDVRFGPKADIKGLALTKRKTPGTLPRGLRCLR